MGFWKKKADLPHYAYDSERERAVIRASICTGEQVAGFRDKQTNEFHEVMLIRDEVDRELFMRTFGLEKVDKEY